MRSPEKGIGFIGTAVNYVVSMTGLFVAIDGALDVGNVEAMLPQNPALKVILGLGALAQGAYTAAMPDRQ